MNPQVQAIIEALLAKLQGQVPVAQPKPQTLQGINGLLGPGMSANPPPTPPRAMIVGSRG